MDFILLQMNRFKQLLLKRENKITIIIFIICALIIDVNFFKEQSNKIYVNEVSPKTFVANRDYNYINNTEIERQLNELDKNEQIFYKYTKDSESNFHNEILSLNNIVTDVTKIRNTTRTDQLNASLRDYSTKNNLDYNTVIAINNNINIVSYSNLLLIEDKVIQMISEDGGITEADLEKKKSEIKFYFENIISDKILIIYFTNIIDNQIKATKIIDEDKTNEYKEQKKLELTQKNSEFFKRGQKIIGQGEVITAQDLSIITDLGLNTNKINFMKYLKLNVIMGFLFLGLMVISQKIERIHSNSNKQKLMYVLMLLLSVGVSISMIFNFYTYGLFVLLPLVIIISDIFLSKRISLYFTIVYSIIIGILTLDVTVLSVYLTLGLIIILLLNNVSNRSELTKISLISTAMATVFIFLLDINNGLSSTFYYVVTLNVLISFFISINVFSIIEKFFNIITPFTLMELQQHPLLQELSTKAPGTMSHSINVANLAKNAALKVGADAQLLYTGALFHDIGKLHNPIMFTENHSHFDIKQNPHDNLNPMDSAIMIKRHVEYGIELAMKNKLPIEIINLIKTHHGNSVIKYFYFKAKDNQVNKKHSVHKEDFSYKWGHPQTKEEGILMLCDVSEAVSKSFDNPTREYLEEKIPLYLNDVINSGELNECQLNLKEIKIIEKSIIDTLININVKRTKYQNQK